MKVELNKYGKKYIGLTIIFLLIQSLILFLSAGNFYILRYWAFFVIQMIYIVFALFLLYKKNPELINARGQVKEGIKDWDQDLVKIINLQMIIVLPIFIGLDYRYQWWPLDIYFVIPGILFYTLSNILVLSSMVVNEFFETHIRIQTDRKQEVITRWPYSFVRHPGYLGTICWLIGVPLILGSLVALVFSYLIIVALIIRTYHEDDYLASEFDGYKEYQKEIKYRLFPGIW